MIFIKEIRQHDMRSFDERSFGPGSFDPSCEMVFDFHLSSFKENELHDIRQNKNTDIHLINAFFRQLDIEDKTKVLLELQKQVFEEI